MHILHGVDIVEINYVGPKAQVLNLEGIFVIELPIKSKQK